MSFVLPKENVREGVPQPVNRAVQIREVPAKMVAVVAFSGFVTDQEVDRRERSLKSALARDPEVRVKADATPEIAQARAALCNTLTSGDSSSRRLWKRMLQSSCNNRGWTKTTRKPPASVCNRQLTHRSGPRVFGVQIEPLAVSESRFLLSKLVW
jgi:hypothetical protein